MLSSGESVRWAWELETRTEISKLVKKRWENCFISHRSDLGKTSGRFAAPFCLSYPLSLVRPPSQKWMASSPRPMHHTFAWVNHDQSNTYPCLRRRQSSLSYLLQRERGVEGNWPEFQDEQPFDLDYSSLLASKSIFGLWNCYLLIRVYLYPNKFVFFS
jgi:hypothetical protein